MTTNTAVKREGLFERLEEIGIARSRLNQNHQALQEDLARRIDDYCQVIPIMTNRGPAYVERFGMLSTMCSRIPFFIYDLPLLSRKAPTAFTDSIRVFFNANFYKALVAEGELLESGVALAIDKYMLKFGATSQDAQRIKSLLGRVECPVDPVFFLIGHEVEHVRRQHCQRMANLPHDVANTAKDIRINGDLFVIMINEWLVRHGLADIVDDQKRSKPVTQAIISAVTEISVMLREGCGTSEAAVFRHWGKSEEELGAEEMKNYKEPKPEADESRQISFVDICEAVAQDLEDIDKNSPAIGAGAPSPSQTSLHAKTTPGKLRNAAKLKGQIPKPDIEALQAVLMEVHASTEIQLRNARHDAITRSGKKSVTVPDDFICNMTPSNRVELLANILDMKLNPSKGCDGEKSGLSVKDLIADGYDGKGGDHTKSPQDVQKTLEESGLKNVAKVLGYDDLKSIQDQQKEAAAAAGAAIDKADADMKKTPGGRYPGGHLVNYAVTKKAEFYQPVINWKMKLRDIIQACGREMQKDDLEPSVATLSLMASPQEFGYASEDDVVWDGTYLPVKRDRGVVAVIVDTSGSVWTGMKNGDEMLKRFVSETVHMARDVDTDSAAPEVAVIFADTIARGDPVFITPENYEDILRDGVKVGGGGGTNLTAAIQNVLRWSQEGGPLDGRRYDGIIYFTDSYETPPKYDDICSVLVEGQDLPPVVWIVPRECHQDKFEAAVSSYSYYLKFDPNELLDVNMIDIESEMAESRRAIAPRV